MKLRGQAMGAAAVAVLVLASAARGVTTGAGGVTAMDLAAAMGFDTATVVSANLVILNDSGPADPRSFGVQTGALGNQFPTEGATFAVFSSGDAGAFTTTNTSTGFTGSLGSSSGGLDRGGTDGVELRLVLDPPDSALSFSFEYTYLSDEYPEFVGSAFNDFLIVQSGITSVSGITFDTSTGTVTPVATSNIAFTDDGKLISINNTKIFDQTGEAHATGTEFDGQTHHLRTCAPLPNGSGQFLFVISVGDLGDGALDSALFIDNFLWEDHPVSGAVTVDLTTGTLFGGKSQTLEVFTGPNPYLPHTGRVTIGIDEASCGVGTVISVIEIYDLAGRRVASLPGDGVSSSLSWDGRNATGQPLASGTYLYMIRSNEGRAGVDKFTLIR